MVVCENHFADPDTVYVFDNHLREVRRYSTGTQDLEKNPPCNAEDNLRAGLIVIEAWFRGY